MQSREEIKGILLQTLKDFWGYDAFRDVQEDIIFSVIYKQDTLVLLPTGGGKSLCYQLPALVMEGMCLVISPLLALMKDQVSYLKSIGVEAEYLSAEMDEGEQERIYDKAIRGEIKILYVSPERLSNSTFFRKIVDVELSFIAVDEAHCISEWGQDFRPSYQHIRRFREEVGNLPCLALTATATPKVVADIEEKLGLIKPKIFQKSYQRDNLRIFIEEISDKYERVFNFLKYNPFSGIIYVRTRKEAEELTQFLVQKGLRNVDFYHAGLSPREKNEKQKKWQNSNQEVLVSTNAFGMGIDKDNVRFVMHFSPSVSLENYYQEIGRAGRDGYNSNVYLLWNEQELSEIDDVLKQQIPNKTEFLKVINSLYSIFQIADGENSDLVFQLDLKRLQKSTYLSYAKIKNILNFLHNQEIIYWNNYKTFSTIELKLSPDDLESLPQKEAYFVELLFRNLAGVSMNKVSFNEKALSNKFGINQEDVRKRIQQLSDKGLLEYIDGNQDSVKFIAYRDMRSFEGKIWKFFEQIQKNKMQKWEEMKYFIRNQDYCKMRLILAYFGEKKAENCGKCSYCLALKGASLMSLEDEILELLKKAPMSFDELRIKKYEIKKELLLECLIGLLNLDKIKMLNYKTYMINE